MNKYLYYPEATQVEFRKIGNIGYQQDGAMYNGYVFHFHARGDCNVYTFPGTEYVSTFTLGGADCMKPHSNSVSFGNEFYDENDEFPLIYCNVYNNYQKETDRREGACCVYRITRQGNDFKADLVQVIKVGFVCDTLWKSENVADVRPYGNFVIDNKGGMMYAFVMRDEEHKTRFFKFRLPSKDAGELCEKCGVKFVTIQKEDICDMFDAEYTNYMQGATYYDGYIYSVEGFNVETGLPPALRIYDVNSKQMVMYQELMPLGMERETEFIEVYKDKLYYGDREGDLYEVTFK